ncbi:4Fe-4S cluster-binding domain-containing protein [Natroniella sulfidigena]|uniref:7-carboxy-7-deazaguanine synthase QueE n=1 Tax=Natroniella sulfidigena TaxID=723921 RepID=UPI002009EA09|nr:radical SAM protein [Natroniella sulfidigena]MCK8818167.1 4Fe-4S cluster-binding domain-containing protein [Natroniella sulfidigena]
MKIDQFRETKIPVVEIFNSISGEGISAGEIVTFVRVAGCNLRCSYCDTQYSYEQNGEEVSWMLPEEIVEQVAEFGSQQVICTGGEPLESDYPKRYLPLYLAVKGFAVRIETNGSCQLYDNQEFRNFLTDSLLAQVDYTVDVKCPSSGMAEHDQLGGNIEKLDSRDELKFVVGSQEDIEYAEEMINNYRGVLAANGIVINFSPVSGELDPAYLVDFLTAKEEYFNNNGLKVRLSLQIHKIIWSEETRGV